MILFCKIWENFVSVNFICSSVYDKIVYYFGVNAKLIHELCATAKQENVMQNLKLTAKKVPNLYSQVSLKF